MGTFPERSGRNRALGVWSAAGSLGIPAGALLGGLLSSALGWRWVLLATAPVALLAAGLVLAVLNERRDETGPRRLDLPGAVAATAGLTAALFAITRTERLAAGPAGPGPLLQVPAPLAVAAALLAVFVAVERRSPAPLLPFSIFRVPGAPIAWVPLTAAAVGGTGERSGLASGSSTPPSRSATRSPWPSWRPSPPPAPPV